MLLLARVIVGLRHILVQLASRRRQTGGNEGLTRGDKVLRSLSGQSAVSEPIPYVIREDS